MRLSQRSLLLFILFLFSNVHLIKNIINKNKKVITFIDNYITWIIRLEIKSNIK